MHRQGNGAAAGNKAGQAYEDSGDENDAERDMIRENAAADGEDLDERSLVSGQARNNSKVSGALLAKAFLPSPVEVKQCLVYTDLAMKMQMIIFDLSSSLWWSSLGEIIIWFPFSFFVFCVDAERMGFIWMFIPHLVRAALGLLIIKKMPTTHEMVGQISIPPNERIPFSKISKFVITGAKTSVEDFQAKAGKLLLIYALLSVVAIVFDLIVIFIGIGGLNNDEGAFSTVFVFLLGMIYFMIALYFIGWAVAVRQRLPAYAQAQVMMGLFGLFKNLTLALNDKNAEVNGGAPQAQGNNTPAAASSGNKPASAPSAGKK